MLPGISSFMMSGASDNGVPNAVDWPNVTAVGQSGSTGLKLITGFASPILLRAEISDTTILRGGNLWTSEGEWISIADGVTIDALVNPDTMFGFDITAKPRGRVQGSVTIKYKSPGSSSFDATLDDFDFDVTGPDIGGLE